MEWHQLMFSLSQVSSNSIKSAATVFRKDTLLGNNSGIIRDCCDLSAFAVLANTKQIRSPIRQHIPPKQQISHPFDPAFYSGKSK